MVGEAAAHVQAATFGERLKAVAAVSRRLLNSPSTLEDVFHSFPMKAILRFVAASALSLFASSCGPTGNEYAENYTTRPELPRLKQIPVSHVAVEEVGSEGLVKQRVSALRAQGYEMVGFSLFNGEYVPPLFAKKLAAQKGCERVVLIREKIGQGVGTRMEAAAYSPPSVGFVNTTLYTPSGRSYSAISTVFNPAQGTYVARDYVYDAYRHGAAFFTRRENLLIQSKR